VAKICLAQPSTGTIDFVVADNQKDFVARSVRWAMEEGHELVIGDTGRYVIQNAREDIADAALEMKCDYIMFTDDDMIIPFDTLEKLFPHMKEADIVIPLTFQRVPPFYPVMYQLKMRDATLEEAESLGHAKVDGKPKWLDFKKIDKWEDDGELFDCDAVGFGCVLLKTEILGKLPKPWFSSWTTIGEDIWFSWQAKLKGFRVCCDTSFWIGHLADRPLIGRPQFEEYRDHKKVTCWEEKKDKLLEVVNQ